MEPANTLLELQETDLDVARCERELEDLPEKGAILAARKKLREVQALLAKANAYAGEVDRAVARNEDETSGLDAKIAVEQSRLASGTITDHREVTNITREMDGLKRRKDKLEVATLALMEKAETGRKQVETIDAALARLSSQEEELVERFKQAGSALVGRIDALHARRATLAAALPADLLDAYESARSAKHGIGAARLLEDGVCGACRVELPADKVHVLKDGPDIAECPMCKRLLVVRLTGGSEA